ncbi:MAG: threonine/serine exporter family protein [Oscillospiraceae bacterium]
MDYDALLDLVTEVGFRLELSGAEIYRVEESVTRLLAAYGIPTGEVFAIPNCLTVSLSTPKGHAMTRVRRIPHHGTDLYRIEALNSLCRKLCSETPDFSDARKALDELWHTAPKYPLWVLLCAYFIGAGFFSLFWGGNWQDGLCGGICGVAIGLCLTFFNRLGANLFFKTLAGGAVSAVLALLFTTLGLGKNVDFITIGALMILVPGVAMTNAIRDIMEGDLISGIAKLGEALLVAAAIALGTGLALTFSQWWGGGML